MASSSSAVPSAIAALSTFSTCELSDALIKLGVPHGGHIPDIQHIASHSPYDGADASQRRICGPAYTVQMVFADDRGAPRPEHHFVDMIVPGSVVVIDAPADAKNAVWGGLMTAGAIVRGAVGAVISGRCRDVSSLSSSHSHSHSPSPSSTLKPPFAIFARGKSTLGQSTFTRASAVQVPLHIAAQPLGCGFPDVVVRPGDVVAGDEDGVVCVPAERVEEVLGVVQMGREVDRRCEADIWEGVGVGESFRRHRGK